MGKGMANTAEAEVDAEGEGEEAPKKGGLKPLLIGLVLALAGGGGGFFLGSSGMLGGGSSAPEAKVESGLKDTVFVDLEPLIVSIERPDRVSQLMMELAIEVDAPSAGVVQELMPRLKDVLNSYLRAVDTDDFIGPGAMVRMRAQMLRRVQIVVGEDAVHDLLVQEFVVN